MGFKDDAFYLRKALELAKEARDLGDTPFGSLLVDASGNILMEERNSQILDNDISAHSELKLAKRAAAKYDENFLKTCTMYNSAEPCTMCSGAIFWSGIGRVVYGISKKRLNQLSNNKTSIPYSIHDMLSESGKNIEIIGPFDDLEEEINEVYQGGL